MDLRRLRAGEWLAAGGGVALLVSLFLPWYRAEGCSGGGCGRSAWDALAASDVVLALVAASGVALLFVTAGQRVPAVPIAMDAIVALGGIVAVVLTVVRVAWLPDGAGERAWGLWLALAGAGAIFAGGWVAMRDERLSPPGRSTDLTGRPAPPPPEPEVLPAPPPRGASR